MVGKSFFTPSGIMSFLVFQPTEEIQMAQFILILCRIIYWIVFLEITKNIFFFSVPFVITSDRIDCKNWIGYVQKVIGAIVVGKVEC